MLIDALLTIAFFSISLLCIYYALSRKIKYSWIRQSLGFIGLASFLQQVLKLFFRSGYEAFSDVEVKMFIASTNFLVGLNTGGMLVLGCYYCWLKRAGSGRKK